MANGTIRSDNHIGLAFLIVQVLFMFAAIFSFGIRMWSRKLHKTLPTVSDYLCLFGVFGVIGLTAILWMCFSHGIGGPVKDITKHDARIIGQNFTALSVVWNFATVCVRLSVLLLYMTIFTVPWFVVACYVNIGINAACFIGVFITSMTLCIPIEFAFDKTIKGGHCGDLGIYEHFLAVWNLIADIAVVLLPMPVLWTLQMNRKRKVALSLLFGVGLLICILTIGRLIVRYKFALVGFAPESAIGTFLAGMEPALGVLCACLPFAPSVFTHVKTKAATGSIPLGSRFASKGRTPKASHQTSSALGSRQDQFSRLHDYEMGPLVQDRKTPLETIT